MALGRHPEVHAGHRGLQPGSGVQMQGCFMGGEGPREGQRVCSQLRMLAGKGLATGPPDRLRAARAGWLQREAGRERTSMSKASLGFEGAAVGL